MLWWSRVTGQYHRIFLLGVIHDDRVVFPGNLVITQKLDIHVIPSFVPFCGEHFEWNDVKR